MARSILFLFALAILTALSHAQRSYAREESDHRQPQKCGKLLIRKEWRTLTNSEKAEWVGAVKVRPVLPHTQVTRTALKLLTHMRSSAWAVYDTKGYP